MRYCENCGAQLMENARFCSQCGMPVETEAEMKSCCPNCKTELEPGMLFCPECGHRVDARINPFPEPSPEPGPVSAPEQGKETPLKEVKSLGATLQVYQNRIEIYKEKKRKLQLVLTYYMQDIIWAQYHNGSIWANPQVVIFTKTGRRERLLVGMYTQESRAMLEQLSELINRCIQNL